MVTTKETLRNIEVLREVMVRLRSVRDRATEDAIESILSDVLWERDAALGPPVSGMEWAVRLAVAERYYGDNKDLDTDLSMLDALEAMSSNLESVRRMVWADLEKLSDGEPVTGDRKRVILLMAACTIALDILYPQEGDEPQEGQE